MQPSASQPESLVLKSSPRRPFRVSLYLVMAPECRRWSSRFCACDSPPKKGCADLESLSGFGCQLRGSVKPNSGPRGLRRHSTKLSRLLGMAKGSSGGGMRSDGGNGGSFDGLPSGFFGRERNGSTDFRNVVYTLGKSLMSSKGRSWLRNVSFHAQSKVNRRSERRSRGACNLQRWC